MIQGFKELIHTLNNFEQGLSSKELNLARAKAFTKYTQDQLKLGSLGLKSNTSATVKIQGKSHNPLSFTNGMIKQMQSKSNRDKSADSGFFASNKNKPEGSKISYTKISILQYTGYRIPLTGPKGEKVRRFLASQGIFPKKSRTFLVVRPRPFVLNSFNRYVERNKDKNVVEKFAQGIK